MSGHFARTSRTAWIALALVAVGLSACSASTPGTGAGGCASPRLESDHATVAPGETIEIRGQNFQDGCADSAGNGTPNETETPMSDVEVVISHGSATILEVPVAITADGSFAESVTLPEDLEPGVLDVTTDAVGTESLRLTVEG